MDQVTINENYYSEDNATFGDRMTGAREKAQMSQKDLARRLGVKLKTIQAWENDLSEPRANRLQTLSGVLNVSLMWMLTGNGDGIDAPDAEPATAPELRGILQEMRELRTQIAQSGDRLARLEKSLRKLATEPTA